MKKNFIILISIFLIFSSSNVVESHPFSWLYDSGKEYLSNMSDVDFWKGACCVMVGVFAVDKCIPLAKSTLRFIFRIPKKETEVEKLNKEIATLKARFAEHKPSQGISEEQVHQLFQKWIKNAHPEEHNDQENNGEKVDLFSMSDMKKRIDECGKGIIKICTALQNHKNQLAKLDQRINNVVLHSNKMISSSSSSESEEDDSEEDNKRQIYSRDSIVPPIDFNKLHRRITSPKSQNYNYFQDSSDASEELTSSSDSDDESAQYSSSTSSISTPRTPGTPWESNSMIIHDDSDYDVEEVKDETGQTEYFVRSPRNKMLGTPRNRITSQSLLPKSIHRKGISESSRLPISRKGKAYKKPTLQKSSSLPLIQTVFKKPNSIQRDTIKEENDADAEDQEEDDAENTEMFFTEDDKGIIVPIQLTPSSPKTPTSQMIAQFTPIPADDEKQVGISEEDQEKIAYNRYYLEHPSADEKEKMTARIRAAKKEEEEKKEREKSARLKAETEEQCNIG